MKLVTFTRDMSPHSAGDKRLVSDELAERLVSAGDVRDPEPFPAVPEPAFEDAPVRRGPGRPRKER